MVRSKRSPVQAQSNVLTTDVLSITMPLINRMKIEEKSEKTITSYVRSVERLVRFHGFVHPREIDIDEVLDFLVYCKEERQINWRTNKMYPDDECQDHALRGFGTIGLICSKMKSLPARFPILRNTQVYLRF